jgi:uncharacterized protein (UPF0261 family)
MKTICLFGAFDTYGSEYAFVGDQLLARGQKVLAVNTGVLGSINLFTVDVEVDQVARDGNSELAELRRSKDRRGQNGVQFSLIF